MQTKLSISGGIIRWSSTNMFQINDRVIIDNYDGKRRKGKVATITSIPEYGGGIVYEYGILVDGLPGLEHHTQHTLMRDVQSDCDCGAVSTHAPNPPPGHAHYCEVNKFKSWVSDY